MERDETRASKMSSRKSSAPVEREAAPKNADLSATPTMLVPASARRSHRDPSKKDTLTVNTVAATQTTLNLCQVYVLLAVLLIGMFVLSAALLAYVDRRLPPADVVRTSPSLEEEVHRQVETILSNYWKSNIDRLSADLLAHARRIAPELSTSLPYIVANQRVQNERKLPLRETFGRLKRDLNMFDDNLVPDQEGPNVEFFNPKLRSELEKKDAEIIRKTGLKGAAPGGDSWVWLTSYSRIPVGIHGPKGKQGRPGTNGTPGTPGVNAWKVKVNDTFSNELLVPPSIAGAGTVEALRPIIVHEGTHLRLRCAATGTPRPHVEWRRDDGKTISNGAWEATSMAGHTLNITKINRVHMGAYQCLADNGISPPANQTFNIEVHSVEQDGIASMC
uniref:Ig-like domain-containing protein n=1 Tax=Anopheles culicifacies TaxID=139723 RepID=A0A182MBY3_9DIPT